MAGTVRSAAGAEAGSRLFSERRLAWVAAVIAVAGAVIMVQLWPALHSGGADQHCLDFTWIWLTGKLAATGAVSHVYDPAALAAAHDTFLPGLQCTLDPGRLDYPPILLFFTYPLGWLPYGAALAAWNTLTLLLYLAAIWAIIPRLAAPAAVLTTYPVALNLLFGHNGFLTAGLFGLALASLERRPWLAGIFLGLLTYKPQFGILFPFALLAARNWRAISAATVASVVLGVAAGAAFGFRLWPMFVSGLLEEGSRLNQGSEWNVWFVSVLGILRHAGLGAPLAWAAQLAVTAGAAAAVCVLWARPRPHALKAAALGIAALVASPYALSYDFCILPLAAAFLVKDGLTRGFLRHERGVILACWVALSFFLFLTGMVLAAVTGGVAGPGAAVLYLLLAVLPLIVCVALFVRVVRRTALPQPEAAERLRPAAAHPML